MVLSSSDDTVHLVAVCVCVCVCVCVVFDRAMFFIRETKRIKSGRTVHKVLVKALSPLIQTCYNTNTLHKSLERGE